MTCRTLALHKMRSFFIESPGPPPAKIPHFGTGSGNAVVDMGASPCRKTRKLLHRNHPNLVFEARIHLGRQTAQCKKSKLEVKAWGFGRSDAEAALAKPPLALRLGELLHLFPSPFSWDLVLVLGQVGLKQGLLSQELLRRFRSVLLLSCPSLSGTRWLQ